MNIIKDYHIGTPGKKWDSSHIALWRAEQKIKRSYKKQVVIKLESVCEYLDVLQYGTLSYATSDDYPLFVLKTVDFDKDKPTVLVTGGVHGYETSGVHGAIRFAQTISKQQADNFNFVIAPCVSPWGYETINRWNPNAVDPNRSFFVGSNSEEATLLMDYINSLNLNFVAHIDLHETTDTDNSEFRPALAARDAVIDKYSAIPDGFYLVGDSQNPKPDFQAAIIEQVKAVTHIALADDEQNLIGTALSQFGVINYEAKALGLCMGLTNADYVTTTEVYPDSPLVDDENCINAQVAVINAALDFIEQVV